MIVPQKWTTDKNHKCTYLHVVEDLAAHIDQQRPQLAVSPVFSGSSEVVGFQLYVQSAVQLLPLIVRYDGHHCPQECVQDLGVSKALHSHLCLHLQLSGSSCSVQDLWNCGVPAALPPWVYHNRFQKMLLLCETWTHTLVGNWCKQIHRKQERGLYAYLLARLSSSCAGAPGSQ